MNSFSRIDQLEGYSVVSGGDDASLGLVRPGLDNASQRSTVHFADLGKCYNLRIFNADFKNLFEGDGASFLDLSKDLQKELQIRADSGMHLELESESSPIQSTLEKQIVLYVDLILDIFRSQKQNSSRYVQETGPVLFALCEVLSEYIKGDKLTGEVSVFLNTSIFPSALLTILIDLLDPHFGSRDNKCSKDATVCLSHIIVISAIYPKKSVERVKHIFNTALDKLKLKQFKSEDISMNYDLISKLYLSTLGKCFTFLMNFDSTESSIDSLIKDRTISSTNDDLKMIDAEQKSIPKNNSLFQRKSSMGLGDEVLFNLATFTNSVLDVSSMNTSRFTISLGKLVDPRSGSCVGHVLSNSEVDTDFCYDLWVTGIIVSCNTMKETLTIEYKTNPIHAYFLEFIEENGSIEQENEVETKGEDLCVVTLSSSDDRIVAPISQRKDKYARGIKKQTKNDVNTVNSGLIEILDDICGSVDNEQLATIYERISTNCTTYVLSCDNLLFSFSNRAETKNDIDALSDLALVLENLVTLDNCRKSCLKIESSTNEKLETKCAFNFLLSMSLLIDGDFTKVCTKCNKAKEGSNFEGGRDDLESLLHLYDYFTSGEYITNSSDVQKEDDEEDDTEENAANENENENENTINVDLITEEPMISKIVSQMISGASYIQPLDVEQNIRFLSPGLLHSYYENYENENETPYGYISSSALKGQEPARNRIVSEVTKYDVGKSSSQTQSNKKMVIDNMDNSLGSSNQQDILSVLVGRQERLMFSMKLWDCAKAEILLILTNYAEAVIQSGTEMAPIPSESVDICIQLLLKLSHSSHGSRLFVHILALYLSKLMVRIKIEIQNAVRQDNFHNFGVTTSNGDGQFSALSLFKRIEMIEGSYKYTLSILVANLDQYPKECACAFTYHHNVARNYIMNDTFSRIDKICHEVGYCHVSKLVIEFPFLNNKLQDSTSDFRFALKEYILLTSERFSDGDTNQLSKSKQMRQLISYFGEYANLKILSKFESIWRSIIIDVFKIYVDGETISSHNNHSESDTYYQRVFGFSSRNVNNVPSEVESSMMRVDSLIFFLEHCREISRMEMFPTKVCCMSADLAFMMAYRRLKKSVCLDIAKSLAVRISSLLDECNSGNSSNTHNGILEPYHYDRSNHYISADNWSQSLRKVVELVQVLCSQTSAEFEHFYELLLARRLLRYRFISLELERRVLAILPAMKKSESMIRDIEQTLLSMHRFRAHVLTGIDIGNITNYPKGEMSNLTFDRNTLDDTYCLNIHILSGTVWPSYWISSTKYSSLLLPPAMEIVKNRFHVFFLSEDVERAPTNDSRQFSKTETIQKFNDTEIEPSENWRYGVNSNNNTGSFDRNQFFPVEILGCTGSLIDFNGIYDPTDKEVRNGTPLYTKRNTAMNENKKALDSFSNKNFFVLEYSTKGKCWQLKNVFKTAANTGKRICVAYCPCEVAMSPDMINKIKIKDNKSSSMSSTSTQSFIWKGFQVGINKWVELPHIVVLKVPVLNLSSGTSVSTLLDPISAQAFVSNIDTPSRPKRRLLWCHAAGSVLLKVNTSYRISEIDIDGIYLLCSEPQLAVLMSFDSKIHDCNNYNKDNADEEVSESKNGSSGLELTLTLSIEELSLRIQMSIKDTQEVLDSITAKDKNQHIIKKENNNNTHNLLYSLSPDLTSGNILCFYNKKDEKIGTSIDHPIVLSNILTYNRTSLLSEKNEKSSNVNAANDYDNYLQASSLRSLHDWRNELIDCCIVRLLKQVMRLHTGEYDSGPKSRNIPSSALPLDILSDLVRKTCDFEHENNQSTDGRGGVIMVTDEDILRRTERLVSAGIIEKVTGRFDSFRSIAYCYLPEYSSVSVGQTNHTLNTLNKKSTDFGVNNEGDKLAGIDLFKHLKLVLEFDGSDEISHSTAISKNMFCDGFLNWLVNTVSLEESTIFAIYSDFFDSMHISNTSGEGKDSAGDLTTGSLSVSDSDRKNSTCKTGLFEEFAVASVFLIHTFTKQLSALKFQWWEGVTHDVIENCSQSEKERLGCNFDEFFKKIAQYLKQRQTDINAGNAIGFDLRYLFGHDKIYFEHLPLNLISLIMDSFCKIVNIRPLSDKIISMDKSSEIDTDFEKRKKNLEIIEDLNIWDKAAEYAVSVTSLKNKLPHQIYKGLLLSYNIDSDVEEKREKDTRVQLTLLRFVSSCFDAAIQELFAKSKSNLEDYTTMSKTVCTLFYGSNSHTVGIVGELANIFSCTVFYCNNCENYDCSCQGQSGHNSDTLFYNSDSDDGSKATYDDEEIEGTTSASDGQNGQNGPYVQEEPMLPCEFCNDVIALSLLDAHQRDCVRIRLGEAAGLDTATATAAVVAASATQNGQNGQNGQNNSTIHQVNDDEQIVNENKKKVKQENTPKSPKSLSKKNNLTPKPSSGLVKSLVTSLLKSAFHTDDSLVLNKNPDDPIAIALENAFITLDTDQDGRLTAGDFIFEDISYEELCPFVDPTIIYSDILVQSEGARNVSHGDMYITSTIDENKISDFGGQDADLSLSLSAIPLSIPMTKSTSLWTTLSNEKMMALPSSDLVRNMSLSGNDETEQEIADIIDRTRAIIDESESTTCALLVHFRWDVKHTIEEYLDNKNKVRNLVGLGPRDFPPFLRWDKHIHCFNNVERVKLSHNDSICSDNNKSPLFYAVCEICLDTVEGNNIFSLQCGHWMCRDCWTGYIESGIGDRQLLLKCPVTSIHKCTTIVTPIMCSFFCDFNFIGDGDTSRHAGKKDMSRKVLDLVTKSFVEEQRGNHNIMTTYCKNPSGCNGIVMMADDADSSEAYCSLCDSQFCATCDLPPHLPATCEIMSQWEQKGGYLETGKEEEEEARKLKHLTTKPCPKCGVRIEKAGGCPHMTCMQPSCRYQFCWDCSGEYHTSSQCNRPKINVSAGSILAFDELDKRCANHFLARRVAIKGYKNCHFLLERTQKPSEASSLRIKAEAWQLLSEAQSALAHSCIVMYYIKSAKLDFLFKEQCSVTTHLQRNLEEVWVGEINNMSMSNIGGSNNSKQMKNNANDREALDNSSENKKHMAEHIFTDSERKAAAIAVRDLKSRLKEYLLLAVCEIASTSSLDTSSEVSKPVQIDCRANSKIPLVLDRISQSKSSHMQLLDLVD